jgi:signal-transduction protein with cAMP-binding, CBS, and nucleotidyltransferase domain
LYFLSQYLSQFSIFHKLPSSIEEILLKELKARYYKKGDVIHDEGSSPCEFMGIIFLGEIGFEHEGKPVRKHKN